MSNALCVLYIIRRGDVENILSPCIFLWGSFGSVFVCVGAFLYNVDIIYHRALIHIIKQP